MSGNKKSYSIGFFDALAIVFIVLKLLGVIKWSWWWVLSPIWIPIIIVLVLYGIIAICDS